MMLGEITLDTSVNVILNNAEYKDEDFGVEISCNYHCKFYKDGERQADGCFSCKYMDSIDETCTNKNVQKEVIMKVIKYLQDELQTIEEVEK